MRLRRVLCWLGLAVAPLALAQTGPAEVIAVSGTVTVQRADGTVSSLAMESRVATGDVVSAQPNSSTRLRFPDKTEVTVAGNSQLRLDQYRFSQLVPEDDSLLITLLKGGLRAVTGLIGHRGNPEAHRVRTSAATIGIRGTDYFARLCVEDCTRGLGEMPVAAMTGADIAARVALLRGAAIAVDTKGVSRTLILGSALYEGDLVETREQGYAVLAFRDESAVTLHPGARLEIQRYRFKTASEEAGVSVMRLLKGGIRAVTGILAKRNPRNYEIRTTVATLGIRGTGFDAWCTGVCEADGAGAPREGGGFYVSTWEGEVEVRNPIGTLGVKPGQTVVVTSLERPPVYLREIPQFMRDAPGPRPDGVKRDLQELFGAGPDKPQEPGLYVLVNDGKIALAQEGRTLELERGESAFASDDRTQLYRLQNTPVFLERDRALSLTSEGGLMCTF